MYLFIDHILTILPLAAGAATSIVFALLSRQIRVCRDKKYACRDKIFLSRQNFCRDKNVTCGSSHQWHALSSSFTHVDFLSVSQFPESVSKHGALTSPGTIRIIRYGERGEGGMGRWGGGRLYSNRYTVTTRMAPALRWAAMRSIFIFSSLIVMDKVTRQCPQTTNLLKRKESRSGIEPRSFCLPA